jgi:hypothetical protein
MARRGLARQGSAWRGKELAVGAMTSIPLHYPTQLIGENMADKRSVEEWKNGVTIKKTRDGYSWTVAVAADANTGDALLAATETAHTIEVRLRDMYPDADGKRRRS